MELKIDAKINVGPRNVHVLHRYYSRYCGSSTCVYDIQKQCFKIT